MSNTYMEQNPNGAQLELVWNGIQQLKDTIELLYKANDNKFTDMFMEELYYQLNSAAVNISNRELMRSQQEEDDD